MWEGWWVVGGIGVGGVVGGGWYRCGRGGGWWVA